MAPTGSSNTNAGTTSSPPCSCYCGQVLVTVTGKPMASSICHCNICRSLTGAPFSAQSLHRPQDFSCSVPPEELWSIDTSKEVTRFRCRNCGSPVYATIRKGKTIVVPLAIWGRNATTIQPLYHMYYKDRIIDMADNLPKYIGSPGAKAALWTPSSSDILATTAEKG